MRSSFWESRPFLYVMLGISVLFTLIGFGMVVTEAEGGWPALLLFGMCAAVFFAKLFPGLFNRHTADIKPLLQTFPAPVTLRSHRLKHVLLLTGSVIFTGLCLWMLRTEEPSFFPTLALVAGVIFFGLCSLALLPILILGQHLELTESGFAYGYPGRRRFVCWNDVSEFETVLINASGARLVVFDEIRRGDNSLYSLNARLIGHTSALPETYGLSAKDLAKLMNKWRKRARGIQRPELSLMG
ncbi:hypothetical protein [Rhizobium oryzicola]|uniref:YcxB family protein n=1 Tax=Rhizobium oryzicola TaxID=1232668 RepID=A0ABT8SSR4_9HYPH|nr:hypothetical protein [Rhizobium oryzicola]MDO1581426.1 hypothetical protein [Rhizobium oryzicola]